MQWLALILLTPYLYLLLRIYYYLQKIQPYIPQKSSDIFVSVIVACRNEEKNLPSLLSVLSAQDYDPDLFEIIIIDDNSTDRTLNIASGFTGIKNLKVIKNSGSGKKKAIKAGVEACTGELVITTDADCRTGINWLKTIVSFYTEHKPDMIISPVALNGSKGLFQRFQELEFLSLQGVTAGTAREGDPVMCNGANMAFTKKVFQNHAGNLREEKVSGDDVFLLHNIKRQKGNRILWLESPEAIVTSGTSASFSIFLSQRARWISKTGSYNDSYTIILAIVTFVTIMLQPILLIAGIFDPVFLLIFLVVFVLKAIPDYLILLNTSNRYRKKNLLWSFFAGQIIYPFYVISVLTSYLFTKSKYLQQIDQ
jgi:cellulose synthase/poly-beta-1,6-N-acetylglucosamine synthase-like glycosyltransferase